MVGALKDRARDGCTHLQIRRGCVRHPSHPGYVIWPRQKLRGIVRFKSTM